MNHRGAGVIFLLIATLLYCFQNNIYLVILAVCIGVVYLWRDIKGISMKVIHWLTSLEDSYVKKK
ncbi:hypothetical protein [Chengkuizengella axinellae]|uniref:DUF2273 domain-containing protein n=1 Tax=Chengkuizengella axinellae TaxID=3064388 RepID=A0ABT9IXH4_9BACL|nr:hypothetical protein [Chengkuizengella sp. 2205SS18-9]MDP5274051.1 hypothetical protein [Chengkuizengella sp. 2205SS18-9]